MSFWKRFLNQDKNNEPEKNSEEPMTPLEEFTMRFTENNGKFILVQDKNEIKTALQKILETESGEEISGNLQFWTYDENIRKEFLENLPHTHTSKPEKNNPVVAYAKFLIRKNGGILFTSYEMGDFRLMDLPATLIFIATPEQLVDEKESAMLRINKEYKNAYPSHIHSIHHFAETDNPFAKNVYLILYA